QYEQRAFPLVNGQTVAVGVRRIHVLPTPLSSYTVCALDEASGETLARHPWLTELAALMKTRIIRRCEPALAEGSGPASSVVTGVAVIGAGRQALRQVDWLLGNGAGEVLMLP